MNSSISRNDRRAFFPRGLRQPDGSFRFSMDALLLASYVNPGKAERLLDLGCGCGVIGLAILLKHPRPQVTGVDIAVKLIECAEQNAARLELDGRFNAYELDLRDIGKPDCPLRPESFDLVMANPPYRRADQGRLPQTDMRESALFESAGGLPDFIRAAAFALKNKGDFYCIWSSERLVELICILREYRLEPKQLRPVQARRGKECGLALLRAAKNGGPGLKLEPPLVIYEQIPERADHSGPTGWAGQREMTGLAEQPEWSSIPGRIDLDSPGSKPDKNGLTLEALAFCPWLACNAKRP